MARSLHLPLVLLVASLLAACSAAPPSSFPPPADPGEPDLALDSVIPRDPAVRVGTLENGLRYYVRRNVEPRQRADLRLVVDAGSILEDDDQLGLAHFAEHMAFNGTEHFAKQELVDYLEGIGMRFGPDLNAYTSFDETVYLLQVPTDEDEIVTKAFDILEDWAHGVVFEAEEIEKERGVVVGEWRQGQGAGQRIRDQQFPVLFQGSRYVDRLPIGEREILETFEPDTIRRFYRDWYRPDLMAVVAVGDFDPDRVEELIREHFSGLENPAAPRPRTYFEVPDHEETLVAIATDPEVPQTSVSIAFKRPLEDQDTVADYRRSLVESLFYAMLNGRLSERAQEAEPPFLGASASGGSFIRTKGVNVIGAAVEEGGLETGLQAVLTEAERARRHGFTETELERQRQDLLRGYEQALRERDKTRSRSYASEYMRNFLEDEAFPGIAYEVALARKYVPGITVAEVNELAERFLAEQNRVILVTAPDKGEGPPATEGELLAVFRGAAGADIEPYVDEVSDEPLLAAEPAPGRIVERNEIEAVGVTEWKLSNGIRVLLKPTDFRNDEIRFTAYSPGGTSLVATEDWVPAITADGVVAQGGLGSFDLIALQKALSGKVVQVSPSIDELTEGISGGGSPEDLETLFQLVYLYFTEPRRDDEAFLSFRNRMRGLVENREAQPEVAFHDRLQEILSREHPRRRPFDKELLGELDYERSLEIYRDRFADAGDFTFIFVGNFDLEAMEPLVARYLGGLPSTGRQETWRDVGVRAPEGTVSEKVYKGLEPDRSNVALVIHGDFEWSRENRYLLDSMTAALRIRLRERLREDLGGTYGVSVSSDSDHYPVEDYQVTVSFTCSPEEVESLTAAVFEEIDKLIEDGADAELLGKITEIQRRQRETDLRSNGFWLSTLRFYAYHDEPFEQVYELDELIESLTGEQIAAAAKQYLDRADYVEVVLLPEALKPAA